MFRKTLMAAAAVFAIGNTAQAATEITWWHAMDGALGDVVNQITEDFNASQDEYKLVSINKGGYEDTMTAGIAAFRAKNQPNIIQAVSRAPAKNSQRPRPLPAPALSPLIMLPPPNTSSSRAIEAMIGHLLWAGT